MVFVPKQRVNEGTELTPLEAVREVREEGPSAPVSPVGILMRNGVPNDRLEVELALGVDVRLASPVDNVRGRLSGGSSSRGSDGAGNAIVLFNHYYPVNGDCSNGVWGTVGDGEEPFDAVGSVFLNKEAELTLMFNEAVEGGGSPGNGKEIICSAGTFIPCEAEGGMDQPGRTTISQVVSGGKKIGKRGRPPKKGGRKLTII